MTTTLTSSPLLNTTNNVLESFKGFYDVMANPTSTLVEKQGATFALASAFVAAWAGMRDSPYLKMAGANRLYAV